METKSIWTLFKRELGYTTASIQYIELSRRISDKICGEGLEGNNIRDTARQYGLSVSEIPEDFTTRIAKNYIVQVHSCLENFLYNFHRLAGSPTYRRDYDREKDNLLHWTMQYSFETIEIKNEYSLLYKICDYYRYVRNMVIHSEKSNNGLRQAYGALSGFRDDKLNAPNSIDNICFDDQVLYARSARQLIEAIFLESQYDWSIIIDNNKAALYEITKNSLSEPRKTVQKIHYYLRQMYPIPETGIPNLLELLKR